MTVINEFLKGMLHFKNLIFSMWFDLVCTVRVASTYFPNGKYCFECHVCEFGWNEKNRF